MRHLSILGYASGYQSVLEERPAVDLPERVVEVERVLSLRMRSTTWCRLFLGEQPLQTTERSHVEGVEHSAIALVPFGDPVY